MPHVKEFKCLGSHLASEGMMERNDGDVEGKALNLLVSPRLCPHLWPRAMGHDQINKGKDPTAPFEISSVGRLRTERWFQHLVGTDVLFIDGNE